MSTAMEPTCCKFRVRAADERCRQRSSGERFVNANRTGDDLKSTCEYLRAPSDRSGWRSLLHLRIVGVSPSVMIFTLQRSKTR